MAAAILCSLQGRNAVRVFRLDCRATIEQRAGNRCVAASGGHVQGGRLRDTAARVYFRARLHQHPDESWACL